MKKKKKKNRTVGIQTTMQAKLLTQHCLLAGLSKANKKGDVPHLLETFMSIIQACDIVT